MYKLLSNIIVFITVVLCLCSCTSSNAKSNTAYSLNILKGNSQDIDWTKDASLKLQKINVKAIKSFLRGEELPRGGLQGMTLAGKFLVFAQVTKNDNNTMLHILDNRSFKLIGTIDRFCFRHANDMTYNKNTGEIMVVIGPKKIAKFKVNTNGADVELTDLSYIECPRTYIGISYDKDHNRYIACSLGKMYVMDENFKEIYSFPLRKELVPQGMAYKDNHVYYSCFESGNPKRPIFNSKEKYSNLIYVYDLKGALKRTLYIPNTLVKGEIESLDFADNGKMIIGYNIVLNGKRTVTFYDRSID